MLDAQNGCAWVDAERTRDVRCHVTTANRCDQRDGGTGRPAKVEYYCNLKVRSCRFRCRHAHVQIIYTSTTLVLANQGSTESCESSLKTAGDVLPRTVSANRTGEATLDVNVPLLVRAAGIAGASADRAVRTERQLMRGARLASASAGIP